MAEQKEMSGHVDRLQSDGDGRVNERGVVVRDREEGVVGEGEDGIVSDDEELGTDQGGSGGGRTDEGDRGGDGDGNESDGDKEIAEDRHGGDWEEESDHAESMDEETLKARAIEEIKSNWEVNQIADILPPDFRSRGGHNYQIRNDNDWDLATLRAFKDLSVLAHNVDRSQLKNRLGDIWARRGSHSELEIGETWEDKEANLRRDLQDLHGDLQGTGNEKDDGEEAAKTDRGGIKRARSDDGTDSRDEESPVRKRPKKSSVPASNNNPPPTSNQWNIQDPSNPAAPANAGNGLSTLALLQDIYRNWQLEQASLFNQIPRRLRKYDCKHDFSLDPEILQLLHDLSEATSNQWNGQNGVKKRLSERLGGPRRATFCKTSGLKAIQKVLDEFTSQGQVENGGADSEQTASDVEDAPEATNTNPSPSELAQRRQLIGLITREWGMTPEQVVSDRMRKTFDDRYRDPLTWDTSALRRLWELGIHTNASEDANALRETLEDGYLNRITGLDTPRMLTPEDSYYVYHNGRSRSPFRAIDLPKVLSGNDAVLQHAQVDRLDRLLSGPRQPQGRPAKVRPRDEPPAIQGPRQNNELPLQRRIELVEQRVLLAQSNHRLAQLHADGARLRLQEARMAPYDPHRPGHRNAEIYRAQEAFNDATMEALMMWRKVIERHIELHRVKPSE